MPVDELKKFSPLGGIEYDPSVWDLGHASWSPETSKIAFVVKNGSRLEGFVFYADPDGSNLKLFGAKPMHWVFYDNKSFFGHDDKRDKKDKHMRLWNLDGEIIEELSGYGCHGTISPDGNWIATESWYRSNPVHLYLYKRGETKPYKILATQDNDVWNYRSHVHPAFSRDGMRVYFNYDAPGSKGSQVYAYDLSEITK